MKIKKEYIFLAVVIAALAAYLATRKQDRSLYDLPEVASVQAGEISRLEVTRDNQKVMFRKEGSDWKISPENYLADPQKVKDMLDAVENITLTELISESKNYQRYDLDAGDGIDVKCWAKDDLKFEFMIGKAAESFNHTFVKLPGDQAVYHARGNFRNKFDMDKGEFREKTVLAFDRDTIRAFEIREAGSAEAFSRVEAPAAQAEPDGAEKPAAEGAGPSLKWADAGGEEADADKINGLLSTLSDLKCEKFMEGKTKDDFSDPAYTITLTGAKEYTLTLYPAVETDGDSFFPAISSENEHPFLMAQWQSENIMKKPDDLKKKPDQTEQ